MEAPLFQDGLYRCRKTAENFREMPSLISGVALMQLILYLEYERPGEIVSPGIRKKNRFW